MKSFVAVLFVAQAVLLQTAYSQILASPCGCGSSLVNPILSPSVVQAPLVSSVPTVVQQPSVANSLADTLSLLTVSSLLAESLPMNIPNVVNVPLGGLPLGGLPLGGLPLAYNGGCGLGVPQYFI